MGVKIDTGRVGERKRKSSRRDEWVQSKVVESSNRTCLEGEVMGLNWRHPFTRL